MEQDKTLSGQDNQTESFDSKKTPQFTIRALMFWTFVVAGCIPTAMIEPNYPPAGVFLVGVYLTVVCGIATLVRFPRSPDAWIPIGAGSLLFALLLTASFCIPLGRPRDEFIRLLFMAGLPLGLFLLIRNVLRIKRTGFSLTVFVYHFGVWLGWMGITVAIIAAPIT